MQKDEWVDWYNSLGMQQQARFRSILVMAVYIAGCRMFLKEGILVPVEWREL